MDLPLATVRFLDGGVPHAHCSLRYVRADSVTLDETQDRVVGNHEPIVGNGDFLSGFGELDVAVTHGVDFLADGCSGNR